MEPHLGLFKFYGVILRIWETFQILSYFVYELPAMVNVGILSYCLLIPPEISFTHVFLIKSFHSYTSKQIITV
jgi:hypothetical protein